MISFIDVPTSELIEAFNALAPVLGHNTVKKFADRETAERRTRMAISSVIDPAQRPGRWRVGDSAPLAALKRVVTGGVEAGTSEPIRERVQEAITVSDAKNSTPTPPVAAVKSALPIPSSDPAKDAEMPTLRRALKLVELAPKKSVYPRKEGSKQALLVDMLSRPEGATFGELYDALAAGGKPWRGVTIRSGLAWDMNHIAGYGVTSTAHTGEEFWAMSRLYEARRLGTTTAAYDPAFKLLVYRLSYPKDMTGPLPHTPTAASKKAAADAALAGAMKKGGEV